MRRRTLLAGALAAPLAAPLAEPFGAEPAFSRGVNITGWFRFPAGLPDGYMSDAAIADLRRAGFSHVRLPVTPEALDPAATARAIRRLQAHGLGVIVGPAPARWRLETSASDRASLRAFWVRLAPALTRADPHLLWPEVLNEPVFASDTAAWAALQRSILADIRAHLPRNRVLLTGPLWGGVDGLLRLSPVADPRVVYSVHFYEPLELTALAAYRPGLDRAALARLPFPVAGACRIDTDAATRALAGYYCAQRWDAARIGARLQQVSDWAARSDARVLIGEFGASRLLNAPARLAWLDAVRAQAELRGIGWTLWGYDDVMGFDVSRPPPSRPRLDAAVLRALGLRAQSAG